MGTGQKILLVVLLSAGGLFLTNRWKYETRAKGHPATIEVIDQDGKRSIIPTAEAQYGIVRGTLRPVSKTIRILRGDEVRTTTPDKLAEAESYGWVLIGD